MGREGKGGVGGVWSFFILCFFASSFAYHFIICLFASSCADPSPPSPLLCVLQVPPPVPRMMACCPLTRVSTTSCRGPGSRHGAPTSGTTPPQADLCSSDKRLFGRRSLSWRTCRSAFSNKPICAFRTSLSFPRTSFVEQTYLCVFQTRCFYESSAASATPPCLTFPAPMSCLSCVVIPRPPVPAPPSAVCCCVRPTDCHSSPHTSPNSYRYQTHTKTDSFLCPRLLGSSY